MAVRQCVPRLRFPKGTKEMDPSVPVKDGEPDIFPRDMARSRLLLGRFVTPPLLVLLTSSLVFSMVAKVKNPSLK